MERLRSSTAEPTTTPRGAQIALRLLLLIPAWFLFFFWWTVVLRRLSWFELRQILAFLIISFVIIFTATVTWIIHCRRLYRRSVPRNHVWTVHEDFTRDALGRPLVMQGGAASLTQSAFVRISVAEGSKIYTAAPGPVSALDGRAGGTMNEPAS